MRPFRHGILLAALLGGAMTLASPHRWSQYDDTRGTWLKGSILSTWYERPHQIVELQQDGAAHRTWRVILASPSKMESRGLKIGALTPGLKIRVYIYPAIDVADEGRALRIDIGGNVTELW